MSEFYGEWLHRACLGNLVIEIDAEINEETGLGDLIFRLRCTKCEYRKEFARLTFELEDDVYE